MKKEIYIPKDLDDAIKCLKEATPKEELEQFKTLKSGEFGSYHHGCGTAMRNMWGLWHGSRLAKWFNKKGIRHADDMSGIIMQSTWCDLNDKPRELDKQIKFYQDYWKKQKGGQNE